MAKEVTAHQRNMIYLMLIGCFLGSLNQTILSPALPSIMEDLHIDAAAGQWLTTIFLLINGIMIPCTAYLMARYTTRQLYLTAMSLFALGTLCAGFSHFFLMLLFARVLQAVGFGILMPLLSGTVLMVYPANQRGKAMGMVAMMFSVAPAIGPSVAGFIVDSYRWNYVFLGLVPLILLDIIICFFMMPRTGDTHHIHLDKPSVLLSTVGFGGLLYGFSSVGSYGWLSVHTILPLIVGIIVTYLFVKRQRHLEEPLLRFEAFQDNQFTSGLIIAMILNAAMLFGGILMPIYVQNICGHSALTSALIMLPGAIISAVLNPIVGSLFDRWGGRPVILCGLTLLTVGSFSYIFFHVDTPVYILTLIYTIRMMGINIAMSPINTWSMANFDGEQIPHANAVYNTLRQIAGSVGTAIFVSIYTVMAATINAPALEANLTGFHIAFVSSACLMLFALILAFIKVKKKPTRIYVAKRAK